MKIIGRLICLYKRKHRRGVLVAATGSGGSSVCTYECPRCGRRKTYKSKRVITSQKEPQA